MSDSNFTKNALAQSMKNLMRRRPFEKISVSDICEIEYPEYLSIFFAAFILREMMYSVMLSPVSLRKSRER